MKFTAEELKLMIAALDHFGRANGYQTWPQILDLIAKLNKEPDKDG